MSNTGQPSNTTPRDWGQFPGGEPVPGTGNELRHVEVKDSDTEGDTEGDSDVDYSGYDSSDYPDDWTSEERLEAYREAMESGAGTSRRMSSRERDYWRELGRYVESEEGQRNFDYEDGPTDSDYAASGPRTTTTASAAPTKQSREAHSIYFVNITKTGYDPVYLEERQVSNYIGARTEIPFDNIVFQYDNGIYLSKRSVIQEQLERGTFYECRTESMDSYRPIAPDKTFFNMNSIGILIGIIPKADIDAVLRQNIQLYTVVKSRRNVPYLISKAVTRGESMVGGLHCQEGSGQLASNIFASIPSIKDDEERGGGGEGTKGEGSQNKKRKRGGRRTRKRKRTRKHNQKKTKTSRKHKPHTKSIRRT